MDQQLPIEGNPDEASDPFSLYAIAEVQSAVGCASISRAHGALLAALRPDVQSSAIKALTALPMLPGVGEVKDGIQMRAVSLERVNFDKRDCKDCRFNSSNHSAMYGFGIDPGYCVNAQCSTEKTELALVQQAAELQQRFRVVRIHPAEYRVVCKDGDNGLGSEQYKHCTEQCTSFGAVVRCTPGHPSEVVENVCTDAACNDHLAEQHRLALLGEFRTRVWRFALKAHVTAMHHKQKLAALLAFCALGWSSPDKAANLLGVQADCSLDVLIKACVSADPASIESSTAMLAAELVDEAPAHQVAACIRALRVQIQDYWKMTPAFLKRLNLDEIDAIAHDLQIRESAEMKAARASGSRFAMAQAVGDALTPAQLRGYVPASIRV